MEHALAFAETGHLAISTLHANNANQALDRIINFFPSERHAQVLQDLGLNVQAIVSQRLVPTVDNKRVAAVEVLLGTKTIQDLIYKGDIDSIKEIMAKSETLGMQTFDAALFKLYQSGKITLEEALKNSDSANNLRLRIKLAEGGSAGEDSSADGGKSASAFEGLSLEKTDSEKEEDERKAFEDAELERFRASIKKD
jgi:twitching motility protein PilU